MESGSAAGCTAKADTSKKKKTGASVTYEGHLSKNGKQGEGIMNKDGEIYRGGWSKNLRHGQGKCCYKNGDVYEGRWIGGKRSGRGRLISKDGSVYVGLWVDGRQHGKGELWYPDGALAYQGDWENGKMSGNGILCYQKSFGAKSLAGRCYEGEFKQNTFEGRGTFYFPMGDCITTGKFIRNQFHGKHQMFWKNGLQLQCSFTQGRLNGNVTATFPDGISTRFVLDNWVSKHANVMGMSANWQIKLKQYLHKQHETKPFEMNTVFST